MGCGVALLAIGLITRMTPLFLGRERLLRQFITEDGYLMLTVARNIALGNGMSVTDGTVPTNGVQPLATLVYAACFWLADTERTTGAAYTQALSIAVAIATAVGIVSLARALTPDHRRGWELGLLAAGIWFSAPILLRHTMNGLETGLYLLAIVVAANLLVRWADAPDRAWPMERCAAWGLVLGATFWIRNDAVFLVASFSVVWLTLCVRQPGASRTRRAKELVVMGSIALVVASPWLAYNYIGFGSIVPISGISESFDVHFGEHAHLLPVRLAEHALFFLPEFGSIVVSPTATIACLLLLGVLAVALVWGFRRAEFSARVLILTMTLLGTTLAIYYGFFFDAPYFLSRYLAAPTPVIALGGAAALILIGRKLSERGWGLAVPAASIGLVLLALYFDYRLYARGLEHRHFQVVGWVKNNLNEQQWVGAIQTGTLGFFHDRTINLDGKVNPMALRARRQGKVLDYVVNSDIDYLVDWVGILRWADQGHPTFGEHFEKVVSDPHGNLGVLRRVQARR